MVVNFSVQVLIVQYRGKTARCGLRATA